MKNITFKNIKELVRQDKRFDSNKVSEEMDWLKDYVDLRFDVLNELIHFKTEEIINKIDEVQHSKTLKIKPNRKIKDQ